MSAQIQEHHLQRTAHIYLRQSSLTQVRRNVESTDRQFHFRDRAIELGWPKERIRILAGDLGVSGSQTYNREDFKSLVAEVSLGHVGAVFALEAQRLARSNADWHRLMELCALNQTLIIDADGCYDPSDFNDGLLLGLKATMSQAELHFMRERLQGAKLNKARRGELRTPLPIGYCYDEQDRTILDPDQQVREVIELLFTMFREVGSAYGVVHRFATEGLEFPKHLHGGPRHGQLTWDRLNYRRVICILHNPCYAGAYVYGRREQIKALSPEGEIYPRVRDRPMEDWLVRIQDHHESYISWSEYLDNLQTLERNRPMSRDSYLKSTVREGPALLQGLLFCGLCGRRLSVSYRARPKSYSVYSCNGKIKEGTVSRTCMSIRGDVLDEAVSRRALEVVEPLQIELALGALEELERREEGLSTQWRLRLERAEYEAELAARRYEAVDPDNRLVASTLERRWNAALERRDDVRRQARDRQKQHTRVATPEQKQKVLALARDFPRVWKSSTTRARDKKRMLRLLIKDITIRDNPSTRQVMLQIRWQGGATEELLVDRPPKLVDLNSYPSALYDRIRQLAQRLPDPKIAELLETEGWLSKTEKPFTPAQIRELRYRHHIPQPQKRPEELTVQAAAQKLGVKPTAIYYWIKRGLLPARQLQPNTSYWITLDSVKEQELLERIRNSPRCRRS